MITSMLMKMETKYLNKIFIIFCSNMEKLLKSINTKEQKNFNLKNSLTKNTVI